MPSFQVAQKNRKCAIHQSGEDYLEAILMLQRTNGAVRSVDIARFMNISKPSVTNALSKLKKHGYVYTDTEGNICLAAQGTAVAEMILERHLFFSDLLIRIGVSPDTAKRDACQIEHAFSEESFLKFREYIDKTTADKAV